jgi:hypothetical protein
MGTQLRDLSSLSGFLRNSARSSSDNLVRCSNHVTQPAADARFGAVDPNGPRGEKRKELDLWLGMFRSLLKFAQVWKSLPIFRRRCKTRPTCSPL